MSARRRHTAEITSDRLAVAVERWHEIFTPAERDMIGQIRDRLERIAEADDRKVTRYAQMDG
jgi:hypothetical protein